MKTTKEQLAAMINGRHYGDETNDEIIRLAEENNLVAIFGYSDDLVEIVGAIEEEFGGPCDLLLIRKGDEAVVQRFIEDGKERKISVRPLNAHHAIEIDLDSDDSDLLKEDRRLVRAIWQEKGWPWSIKTNLPHAAFDIYEENDDLFCRGIVVSMDDCTEK